jgi:hypothetical protein
MRPLNSNMKESGGAPLPNQYDGRINQSTRKGENAMLVQEEYQEIRNHNTDNEKIYYLGDSGLYEPFTSDIKRLFRAMMREHGRCISKIYIETDNTSKAIGWVFEKRMKYEDCNEYYICHTWVTLHKEQPTKTIENHYNYLQ